MNNNDSYKMYVLNLDAARIFWIAILFVFIGLLAFFLGYINGKGLLSVNKYNKKHIVNNGAEDSYDSSDYDSVDLKYEDDDEDFHFYKPDIKSVKKKEKLVIKPQLGIVPKPVSKSVKKKITKPAPKLKKSVPKTILTRHPITFEDKKVNSDSPYSIQVASHRIYKNADNLRKTLLSKNYPAYILKSKVNGSIYFRTRVGPFSSKILANKVMFNLKKEKDCANSYIATK